MCFRGRVIQDLGNDLRSPIMCFDFWALNVKGRLGGSMTTSKPTAQTHLFTLNVVSRSSAQQLQNVQNLWQGKIPP